MHAMFLWLLAVPAARPALWLGNPAATGREAALA